MPRLDGEGGLPKGFNAIWVKNAPPKKHKLSQNGLRQISYFENLRKGLTLVLACSFKGSKTWRALVYVDGAPRSFKLGTYPQMSLQDAYAKAREFHASPDEFRKAREAKAAARAGSAEDTSFKAVAENWLKREKQHLRSKIEYERYLGLKSQVRNKRKARTNVYIPKEFMQRPIVGIRRRDIANLLDKIEDKHGKGPADDVLGIIRQVADFWAARDDDYSSPVVKAMKRDKRKTSDRARTRILDDDELRALWKVCETDDMGGFGAILRLALLTGQRSRKVAAMKWDDFDGRTWTVPHEQGEKVTGGVLDLPDEAIEIIEDQRDKRIADNPYVFHAAFGDGPFNSFSQRREELDKALPKMERWVVHDLRRTARSLMSRAGVRPDHAERVLGHTINGVEGVYDRHDYRDEKAAALEALASLIDTIIHPPRGSNILPLRGRSRG